MRMRNFIADYHNITLHPILFHFWKIRKRDEPTIHDIDNLAIIDLEGQQDLISNEFVCDNDQIDHGDHLAHWLADDDLKNSETETLPAAEEQFWMDLIRKYLEPIEPTDEEKVLTITIFFCFEAVLNIFDLILLAFQFM